MNKWSEFLNESKQDIVYGCENCNGRSQVCDCRAIYGEISALYMAGVPFSFRNYTKDILEGFNVDDPAIERTKTIWEKIFENIDRVVDKGINLYLYGHSGSGKTMLAAAFIRDASRFGYISSYFTLQSLVDAYMQDKTSLMDILSTKDVLVIDDLKGIINDVSDRAITLYSGILETVISHRFENEMCTILISDSGIEDFIDQYSLSRVSSFLRSKKTKQIRHVGVDYRAEMDGDDV